MSIDNLTIGQFKELSAFAVMTALQITPYNVWVANVSSAMWIVWSLRVREWSLVVVNVGLLLVYFAGLFI